MKILSVRHAVPAREVSNDQCRRYIRRQLRGQLRPCEIEQADRRVAEFLTACGTKKRRISKRHEKALPFVVEASRRALDDAGVAAEDVDFVIYTGVGRGWIEPSMAAVLQCELKLPRATCFDILDACASWLRAVQVAHALIRSGTYGCGLIVNCECSLQDYLDLKISSLDELESRLASFTIGEAATATVVSGDVPDDDFRFDFQTSGSHYDLCMIPLDNMTRFSSNGSRPGAPAGRFYSRSRELINVTSKSVIDHFRATPWLRDYEYDMIFSHAVSARAITFLLKKLRLRPESHFGTHAEYGNTVSASVPLGMSLAREADKLRDGTRTLVIIGSAGITVGFATFTF